MELRIKFLYLVKLNYQTPYMRERSKNAEMLFKALLNGIRKSLRANSDKQQVIASKLNITQSTLSEKLSGKHGFNGEWLCELMFITKIKPSEMIDIAELDRVFEEQLSRVE